MSEKVDCIIKNGVVESVDHKYIRVRINSESACSMCYSKGVCTSLGSGERIVEVENDSKHSVIPGETVEVQMISTAGGMAVLFGYVIPFVIFIGMLLIASRYFGEAISALLSVCILVPYYLILHANRNRMKKLFKFTLS